MKKMTTFVCVAPITASFLAGCGKEDSRDNSSINRSSCSDRGSINRSSC